LQENHTVAESVQFPVACPFPFHRQLGLHFLALLPPVGKVVVTDLTVVLVRARGLIAAVPLVAWQAALSPLVPWW
jgi:hypothetical protein